jgi:glycerol-3-phosphate acyltransferase PlsX
MITISVDAMGGANAPHAVIEGAALAIEKLPGDLVFVFVGNQKVIAPIISSYPKLASRYEIIDAPDVISDSMQPVAALRKGRKSSMRKALDLVKEKRANACLSCGNTGALMVMAKMVLGDLPNIKRPAIVGLLPNESDGIVMLDLGANNACDENILVQFAVMGEIYAKLVMHKDNPSIGLLNMGEEESKGTDVIKKTYQILQKCDLNFKGFVEGFDIAKGTVDVVVCDGFHGNIALKSVEGYLKMVLNRIKSAFKRNLLTKICGLIMRKHLKEAFSGLDPDSAGGSMFVGVNGIVVKSHGSSSAGAISAAIITCYELAKQDINRKISEEIHRLHLDEEQGILGKIKKSLGMKA